MPISCAQRWVQSFNHVSDHARLPDISSSLHTFAAHTHVYVSTTNTHKYWETCWRSGKRRRKARTLAHFLAAEWTAPTDEWKAGQNLMLDDYNEDGKSNLSKTGVKGAGLTSTIRIPGMQAADTLSILKTMEILTYIHGYIYTTWRFALKDNKRIFMSTALSFSLSLSPLMPLSLSPWPRWG